MRIAAGGRMNRGVGSRRGRVCRWVSALLLLNTASCGGGGGGSDSGGGNMPPPGPTVAILASNDLGMHGVDADFSVFSMQPPYNVVRAQVIATDTAGHPSVLSDSEIVLGYSPIADATGRSTAIVSVRQISGSSRTNSTGPISRPGRD